ncbi:MAG: LuxR C-terminal-related transcriptional regulator [Ardenticatenia bacterium]|nr:LuxR C-terminal-related transcriptional regulator [Ardenticatenia bacterium]
MKLCRALRPDVVVACVRRDKSWPHHLEAIRTIAGELNISVLVVSTTDDWLMVQALHGGASGFVDVSNIRDEEELFQAVRRVARGQLVLRQEQLDIYMHHRVRLTPNERRMLAFLGRHLNDAEIAARMGIKPTSVRRRVERLCRKLNVQDREMLVELAEECVITGEDTEMVAVVLRDRRR